MGYGPNVAGDGPFIVIEDYDQPSGAANYVIQGLRRYAAGERGVTAHSQHVLPGATPIPCRSHAKRRAQGRAGVSGPIGIVPAFFPGEKAAASPVWRSFAEALAASTAGEELVSVSLVRHVEDESIGARIEHPVEGDGKIDHAEVGPNVAAVGRGDGDDFLADFFRQSGKLFRGERPNVFRPLDRLQQAKEREWPVVIFGASGQPPLYRQLVRFLEYCHAVMGLRDG